jgi:hypothetical protein
MNRRGFFALLAGVFGARKLPAAVTPTAAQREALWFLAGDQWPADVLARRLAAGRPCLVDNRLPAFVQQILAAHRVPASKAYSVIERVVRENRDKQMLHNYLMSARAEAVRFRMVRFA